MRLEILCTGDELLDGTVTDTNSVYFQERAFVRGAVVSRRDTVPDDLDVIAEALSSIGARADFVLVSGGLGPTADDVTAEAAAKAAGVPLELNEEVLARLKERFAKRNIAFSTNNQRQAMLPRGCTVVPNAYGSAPMFVLRIGKALCHFLPGVPREFRGLCDDEVIPRLERALASEPGRTFRARRVLKTFGLPESHLDALVKGLPAKHPHVRFGFRTHAPENHLKLLASGSTAEEAQARLAAVEADARAAIGDFFFGTEADEFAPAVVHALRQAKATVSLGESCTGGLCASLLTSVPGASEELALSAVVYQEAAKTALLGVDPALVKQHGAVSAEVSRALAHAARQKGGTTFGLGITGWAGPTGGTSEDPVGTVYLCLTDGTRNLEQRHLFVGDRERVRNFAAWQALDLLRRNAKGLS